MFDVIIFLSNHLRIIFRRLQTQRAIFISQWTGHVTSQVMSVHRQMTTPSDVSPDGYIWKVSSPSEPKPFRDVWCFFKYHKTDPVHWTESELWALRLCCAAGDGRGSDPDELHPSPEYWSCAAHHRSLPQHAGLGGGTRTAAHVQSCELPGLDGREDPGWRPAGTAGSQRRLLGRYHHKAQVLSGTLCCRLYPKIKKSETLKRVEYFAFLVKRWDGSILMPAVAASTLSGINGIELHFLFGLQSRRLMKQDILSGPVASSRRAFTQWKAELRCFYLSVCETE